MSPKTLGVIAAVIATTGAPFADVGIIGMPPGQAAMPRLHAAGAELPLLSTLNQYGLDVRPMAGPPGSASALKLAYAGITKGLIAVASSMILGASRAGVADALAAELKTSEAQLFGSLPRRVLDMMPKAYRWVAEMREISTFLEDEPGSAEIYQGAAAPLPTAGDRRSRVSRTTRFTRAVFFGVALPVGKIALFANEIVVNERDQHQQC